MPTIRLTDQLVTPVDSVAISGATFKFKALRYLNQTPTCTDAPVTTDVNGRYDIELGYGYYRLTYKQSNQKPECTLGYVYVDDTTTATTIEQLIADTSPIPDENIAEFKRLLAEAESARDLSQQYSSDSQGYSQQSQQYSQDSANSAAESLQYRNQASEIAGLDDVAGAMGLLSKVYGVHDLDIPFNDGVDVLHGYGPVSFSRLSEATDINKSGIPQTFAVDEPVITSKGCAFFGNVTNYVPNWNEVPWSEATTTPTPQNRLIERDVALTPGGLMEADRITASQDSDQQRVYVIAGNTLGNGDSWSVTVKADISEKVQIRTTTSSGVIVNLLDGTLITDYTNGDYEIEPLIEGWFRITIFGEIATVGWVQLLNNGNNSTFDGSAEPASVFVCNAQRSDGAFVPPPVPTTGTAVTREGEIATAPQIGNLPRPGDPFYIVVDVDVTGDSDWRPVLHNIYGDSGYVGIDNNNKYIIVPTEDDGSQAPPLHSPTRTKNKARVIFAYDSNLRIYEDGVLLATKVNENPATKFFDTNPLNLGRHPSLGSMNGYLKRPRIEHGVMTDDLAKAYGKWGD